MVGQLARGNQRELLSETGYPGGIRTVLVINVIALVASLAAVYRSYVPGEYWPPVLGLLFVFVILTPRWIWLLATSRKQSLAPCIVPICFMVLVLALSGYPAYLGFHFCKRDFDNVVRSLPVANNGSVQDLQALKSVGIYQILKCAADSTGGVYFVTTEQGDGLGPDTLSSGFAYRPSKEKTPFGSARYHLVPVADDWFVFLVSNDY